MAVKRTHSYARAYSFGTDGSAALASTPYTPRHPVARMPQRAVARRRGIRLPVWMLVVGVSAVVFVLSFMLLGIRAQVTQAAKQANALRVELGAVQEVIGGLEVKLAEADDPQRILSLAVNRLNMRLPADSQIQVVPKPQINEREVYRADNRSENGGLISLLMSLVGL